MTRTNQKPWSAMWYWAIPPVDRLHAFGWPLIFRYQVHQRSSSHQVVCIGSYPNLRDVQPNPLPERAAGGQGMMAVHPAERCLEPRSPMHLRPKTKNGSSTGSYMIWPELAHHMHLNFEPAFSCCPTHWKVFERKIQATSNEKVGMYREKSALEELIVSGICCWRLRLLRRFFRSDQLLSIFVDSELQRSYFFESNLASSWAPPVVTLKFRYCSSPVLKSKSICFSSDRTLREALFCRLQHIFLSAYPRQSKRQSRHF